MISVRMDSARMQRALKELGAEAANGTEPLSEFFQWWKASTLLAWREVRAAGGSFRGATWKPFADQYTRADGTVVPAWGGVPRVDGAGTVKGRKRPSGKRVTRDSVQMEDAGRLKSQLNAKRPVIERKQILRIDLRDLPVYAAFQNALREFLRFASRDELVLRDKGERYLAKLANKFNRS